MNPRVRPSSRRSLAGCLDEPVAEDLPIAFGRSWNAHASSTRLALDPRAVVEEESHAGSG